MSVPTNFSLPVNASAPTNATASTNGTARPPAAATAKGPVFDHLDLVFNVNAFLLCIAALFFLLLLPRSAIRFTHKREWVDGHILRKQNPRSFPSLKASNRTQQERALARQLAGRNGEDLVSANLEDVDITLSEPTYSRSAGISSKGPMDSLPTYGNWSDLERARSTLRQRHERRANAPTHMPGWSTMLPNVASRLRITVHPGLTIGKALILLGYFGILLYAGLYKSNPFKDPLRAGYVAASQIPVVIAFGTKYNLVGMLIGFGYERINYIHRFAGRMFVLAVNVHALGYLYIWVINDKFTTYMTRSPKQWAFVALICTDLLYLLSTNVVRSRLYNAIFMPSHIILAVVLLVATGMHAPLSMPYLVAGAVLYGLDRVVRLTKTRFVSAKISQLEGLGMTKVVIEDINAGWRSGQHVRLRVWDTGMGWRKMTESHPFTIASVSRDAEGTGLVLLVKKAGDWTNTLYNIAKPATTSNKVEPYYLEYPDAKHPDGKRDYPPDASRAERGYSRSEGPAPVLVKHVTIEGPYGGPGHAIFSSFTGAMFVAGGSGVTFALAAVEDLVKKDLHEHSCIRALQLVWCIQDPNALKGYALAKFKELLKLAHRKYADLEIAVYYTRAPADRDVFSKLGPLPPGLSLSPCRPDFSKVLESIVDRTQRQPPGLEDLRRHRREDGHRRRRSDVSRSGRDQRDQHHHRSRSTDTSGRNTPSMSDKSLKMTGVIVGVCGPASLGDGVRTAVAAFPRKKRDKVGGIELHEEAFGW